MELFTLLAPTDGAIFGTCLELSSVKKTKNKQKQKQKEQQQQKKKKKILIGPEVPSVRRLHFSRFTGYHRLDTVSRGFVVVGVVVAAAAIVVWGALAFWGVPPFVSHKNATF